VYITLPSTITVQANSAQGASVFYLQPTAIDDGHAGVSVTCSPPPDSVFPIQTTQVTCAAVDPRGNKTSRSFNVTVRDTIGPVFSNVSDVVVHADSSGGAKVQYATPTGTDQVSGEAAVTCVPPSGSQFNAGTTPVTCSATDARGNTSKATFSVVVTTSVPAVPTWGLATLLAALVVTGTELLRRQRTPSRR
jgi:hypothetical protein